MIVMFIGIGILNAYIYYNGDNCINLENWNKLDNEYKVELLSLKNTCYRDYLNIFTVANVVNSENKY